MKPNPDRAGDKSRGTTACLAWSLLCAAGAYSVLADAPWIVVITFVGLIPPLLLKRGFRANTRAWVYTIAVALILTVILNEVYEIDNENFFLPANLLVPFLLALGVGLCYVETRQRVVTVVIVCSLAALLFSGTALSDPTHVRLIIPRDLLPRQLYDALNDRFLVFIFTMILQTGSILMLLVHEEQYSQKRLRQSRRTYHKGAFVTFLAQLTVFALGGLMIWSVRVVFPKLDSLFNPMYRSWLRQRVGTHVFDKDIDLNRTLDPKQKDKMDQPALRVHSPIPPGYLRGRVYTGYRDGRWTAVETDQDLPLRQLGGGISAKRYAPGPTPIEDLVRVDVYLQRKFRSRVLFTPGNTEAIELIAERLASSPDGVFNPSSWDRDGGFTAYCAQITQTAAWNLPPPDDQYLQLPDRPRQELDAVVGKIAIPVGSTVEKRVQRTSHYVQNHCDYSLERQDPGDRDPVLYFLENSREGHCELFASSTALLLRSQGIHTRYVTGFVCLRSQGMDDWWLATFGDCHAWIEAWIPGQGWQLVESTPAAGVPGERPSGNRLKQVFQALAAIARHAFAKVKRGYFAEAVFDLLRALWTGTVWLFWSGPWYLGWGLLVLLAAYIGRWHYKRRPQTVVEVQRRELREIAAALDKILAGHGIHRHPAMSLREAATGIDNRMPRAPEFQNLIRDYERLRYRPNPSSDKLRDFLRTVKAWRGN